MNRSRLAVSWESAAAGVLLGLGAVLRLRQYLTGRSLWADEAMLALNIVNRDPAGLFRPLDYDQGAPLGFLLVEKLVHLLLGRGELALRLFPLLLGLVSLWLFYRLSKKLLGTAGMLTALALFAFNPRLVYYSSEVKQYILDVVVAMVLLLVARPVLGAAPRTREFTVLGLVGAAALWFSHPALFVLAGIGLALGIVYLQRRDTAGLRALAGMGLLWALNFGILYVLILNDLSQNAYMREYWQGAFLPMPPWNDPGWFLRALDENIRNLLGIPYAVPVTFGLMVAGEVLLFRRRRAYALALAFILFVTLLAAALQLYPVFERMVLFLVPVALLLLGQVVDGLHAVSRRYGSPGRFATGLLAIYLISGPLLSSLDAFVSPKYFEHIRPTLSHLRDSWKDGDRLYVSHGALPAFRFYAPLYGFENVAYEFGEREDYNSPEIISGELETFTGQPRLWVLLSHVYERGSFNERDFVITTLDRLGEKKREFRVPGTSVFLYLYDLRN